MDDLVRLFDSCLSGAVHEAHYSRDLLRPLILRIACVRSERRRIGRLVEWRRIGRRINIQFVGKRIVERWVCHDIDIDQRPARRLDAEQHASDGAGIAWSEYL